MKHISELVDHLVKTHETRNPFKIAKFEKFIVEYSDYDELKGYYCKILRKKFIFISSNLDEFASYIVCAHELGHALLHSSKKINFSKEHTLFPADTIAEREANLFAAELILTDNLDIGAFYDGGMSLDDKTYKKLVELKNLCRK